MGQDERYVAGGVVERNKDVTTLQIDNDHTNQTKIERLKSNSYQISPEEKPICRICHCSNEDVESGQQQGQTKKKWIGPKNRDTNKSNVNDPFFLITPCYCTGTLRYVHHKCLQQWIRSSNHKYCELCKYSFKLTTKNKPFYQWEFLNMSGGERRKLIFHISFNLVSMICVFWSIYVIAERASMELSGRLGWRFWIKMLVITIGFVCGIMFIIFQLKLYLSILARWKQYNQIIIIENVSKENCLANNRYVEINQKVTAVNLSTIASVDIISSDNVPEQEKQ